MFVLYFVSFNQYTQYSTLVNFALVYGNFSNVLIGRVKFEFRDTSVTYFDVNVIIVRLVNDAVVLRL